MRFSDGVSGGEHTSSIRHYGQMWRKNHSLDKQLLTGILIFSSHETTSGTTAAIGVTTSVSLDNALSFSRIHLSSARDK